MTEVTRLARQLKQLKRQPKKYRGHRKPASPEYPKSQNVRDGSWIRTIALAAVAFTGMGLWKLNLPTLKNTVPLWPSSCVGGDSSACQRGSASRLLAPGLNAESQRPGRQWITSITQTGNQQSLRTPSEVEINQIDLDFIKDLEGFHSTPYFDGTQRSWGYGTKAGQGSITREQAAEEMNAYLQDYCLPILPAGLPDHRATALASFCYNLGPDQAQNTNLWKNAYSGGAVRFLDYTRSARGVSLLSRRRKEQAMWDGL